MVNTVKIIPSKTTGEPIGLHLEGEKTTGDDINQGFPLIQLSIGALTDGSATIALPLGGDYGNFVFTPLPHATDPEDNVGFVNHKRIADLLRHEPHAHDEITGVVGGTLVARMAAIEARLNAPIKVFDELKLEVYKENGKVIGHEWRLEMADNSDTGFAANAHFHGILPQKTGLPIVYIQYFDTERRVVAEVRARCATNHYAGFRYLLNGSAVSDQLYTGAEAETLLHLANQ